MNTAKFTAAAGIASVAAVGLSGALGVGLDGAFAAVGVGAALLNKNVRKEFKDLGTGLKNQIAADAKPVADTMLGLAKYVNSSLKTMRPALQGLFRDIAPLVDVFGKGLVGAVANVVTEFRPLIQQVLPIVRSTFGALPDLIGNLSAGLQAIVKPLSQNTAGWSGLLGIIGSLLPVVGGIVGQLVDTGTKIMPALGKALDVVGKALSGGLGKILPVVGAAISKMLPPLSKFIGALAGGLATVGAKAIPALATLVSTLADKLAPVIGPIADGIGSLVDAAISFLPALTPLIGPLALIVKGVGNLIGPLATVAGAMATALAPALKVLGPLLASVAGMIGGALSKAFKEATPALTALATAVGALVVAWAPVIAANVRALLGALTPLIPAAAKIAAIFAGALVPIVQALAPILVKLAPAIIAVALAMKALAIAQGILNVIMEANPILLVATAIGLLIIGLVAAYQHSATFRRIVNDAFHAVAAAGKWMWEIVLRPAFFALATAFLTVAGTIVHGAALAFGWIPGIGPKLKGAAKAFDTFKAGVLDALDGIPNQKSVKFYPIDQGLLAYVAKVKSVIGSIPNPGGSGIVHGPFQHGSWFTPGGLALIHPGEMIIPSAPAERIRRGGFGGGAAVVNQYHYNISVNGTVGSEREVIQWVRKGIREALRN